MRRFLAGIVVFSFLSATAFAGNDTLNTTGKRAGIVGKTAVAGAAGGLVVGMASQAFKRKTKNIFLFGSIGFYVGILTGIYLITAPRGSTPYEGPDTYDDYGTDEKAIPHGSQNTVKDPFAVEVSLVSLNF
jgi:hypothetical protein